MMYKVIALVGESGSGKDRLLREILAANPSLHKIVNCTTRPQRENEYNGIHYFYMSKQEFAEKVLDNEMLEHTTFRDWYYGTSYDSLDANKINIGVFNPDGVEQLQMRSDIDLIIIRVRASAKTRLLRQLNREEHPDVNEIVRRYIADQNDFKRFRLPCVEVSNETEADLHTGVQTVLALA